MTYHVPHRIRASLAAAAMGVALVGGLTACTSTTNTPTPNSSLGGATGSAPGGGGVAGSAEICSDLATQTATLEQQVLGSLGTVDPTTMTADQLTTLLATVKTAFTTLSATLRSEAAKASDSGLAKALTDDATALDTSANGLANPAGLATLLAGGGAALNFGNLATYCPDTTFGE